MTRTVLIAMLLCVNGAAAEPLTEHRWKHRLLIVFAENGDNPAVAGFRQDLSEATCELENRDVIVGWFFENGPARLGDRVLDDDQAQAIWNNVQPDDAALTTVLLGKDGSVKARYTAAPSLDELFALIDGMPMRRAEIRSRERDCGP